MRLKIAEDYYFGRPIGKKIADLQQTEARLKIEKDALQIEMNNKLALKDRECQDKILSFKTRVVSFINSL